MSKKKHNKKLHVLFSGKKEALSNPLKPTVARLKILMIIIIISSMHLLSATI